MKNSKICSHTFFVLLWATHSQKTGFLALTQEKCIYFEFKKIPFFNPIFLYKYGKICKNARVGPNFDQLMLGTRARFFDSVKSSWSPIIQTLTYSKTKNLTLDPPPLSP